MEIAGLCVGWPSLRNTTTRPNSIYKVNGTLPIFVHIAPANAVRSIRRSGIRRGRWGVYCMPVVPDFHTSHQWARELKRRGYRAMALVYFSLPDAEPVLVGRYNEPHRETTASGATREVMRLVDAGGYEVIVERAIGPRELRRVAPAPAVGWRYQPGAHRPPFCLCCSRGEIKIQRQKRYAGRLARLRSR